MIDHLNHYGIWYKYKYRHKREVGHNARGVRGGNTENCPQNHLYLYGMERFNVAFDVNLLLYK